MVNSENLQASFDALGNRYTLKGIRELEYYLGANMKILGKQRMFFLRSGTCIKRCLIIYEQNFGKPPPQKVNLTLEYKDQLEMYESDFLDDKVRHLYWELLGVL